MFTIANKIAYNEKMLNAQDDIKEDAPFVWGPSTWFDVSGESENKHFVPAQAEHVLQMLYEYIDAQSELPNCYIISPFRKVKTGLIKYLRDNFTHTLIEAKAFKTWLDGDRVGTVHTFQGKEDELVIFVLGASKEAEGAAMWAASKPNILNVAVTRAKKRVYIVGCKKLWSNLDYFACAAGELVDVESALINAA
jgi:superfamily I DNA and/or RNA helicase